MGAASAWRSQAGSSKQQGQSQVPLLPELTSEQHPRSRNAFVSVLYAGTPRDYEYYVGVRVTLHTVRRTGTAADLVVLASRDVPQSWVRTLTSEGFRVVHASNLPNPYNRTAAFRPRFRFVLNKLLAWRLMEYQRVVLLDADNLVLRNMDELFLCGDFCAVFIDPCIFHTGLLVLKPSQKVFLRMLRQLGSLPSFDAADQGFLTSFYPHLLDRPLFAPPALNLSGPGSTGSPSKPLRGLYRLPMGYQMDAIYYNLRFRWHVPCSENKVITFPGIPALKPWFWWAWPLFPLALHWHAWRATTVGYARETVLCALPALLWLALLLQTPLRALLRAGPLCRHRFREFEGDPVSALWAEAVIQVQRQGGALWSLAVRARALASLCLPGRLDCLMQQPCFRHLTAWAPSKASLCQLATAAAIPGAALVSSSLVPATVHPLMGWPLFFLGTIALLKTAMASFGAPVAVLWLPAYSLGAVVLLALPMYSSLASKVVGLCVLAFGGGVVALRSYLAISSHDFDVRVMPSQRHQ